MEAPRAPSARRAALRAAAAASAAAAAALLLAGAGGAAAVCDVCQVQYNHKVRRPGEAGGGKKGGALGRHTHVATHVYV